MRNGQEPAYPLEGEQWIDPENTVKGTYFANGLTKIEYFTAAALQGLCVSSKGAPTKSMVTKAVAVSLEALKQLEGHKDGR